MNFKKFVSLVLVLNSNYQRCVKLIGWGPRLTRLAVLAYKNNWVTNVSLEAVTGTTTYTEIFKSISGCAAKGTSKNITCPKAWAIAGALLVA